MARSRLLALWLGPVLVLATAPAAAAQDATTSETETTETTETTGTTTEPSEPVAVDEPAFDKAALRAAIRRHRAVARHWKRVMGISRRLAPRTTKTFASNGERLAWLRARWRLRARSLGRRAKRPPHIRAWRCIHAHEGPWDDPNAPYYGGLQMDVTFQRMYGRYLLRRKGTADRWRPREQMWVAERALRAGRGFYPWPVAARRCGLI